jgi:hypothetical protein
MPFASAEVLTLLPTLSNSFKVSSPRQWMGVITADHSTAISGLRGRAAAMTPLEITVKSGPRRMAYRMGVVNDRILTPFLVQMAVFSALDATERTLGPNTFRLSGTIEFQGAPPVTVENLYAGDFNLPLQAALGAAVPLSYAMQSGFDALKPRSIKLELDSLNERKQLQIDQAWPSRRVVRPGDTIDLTVLLTGDNGVEMSRTVQYRLPVGAPAETLYFTVADGVTTNLTEFRQTIGVPSKSPQQVVGLLNALRPNTKAYVRVWRGHTGYQAQGEDLPDPPASAALILSKAQASTGAVSLGANSKVAELEIDAGDYAVTGTRTVSVEVKE